MPPRNPVAYQALNLNDAITEHLPLVKRIAYQIASRLPPNVELDDLVQEGLTGLLDALKRCEPQTNLNFEGYALTRCRGDIYVATLIKDTLDISHRQHSLHTLTSTST